MTATNTLDPLETYRKICEQLYITWVVGGLAMKKYGEALQKKEGWSDDFDFSIPALDEADTNVASMKAGKLVQGLTEGPFSGLLAQSVVCLMYDHWEDTWRGAVAVKLGIEKKEMSAPVMGDLRHIRNAITHKRGDLGDDIHKLEILNCYNENGEVFLSPQTMYSIHRAIQDQTIEPNS